MQEFFAGKHSITRLSDTGWHYGGQLLELVFDVDMSIPEVQQEVSQALIVAETPWSVPSVSCPLEEMNE